MLELKQIYLKKSLPFEQKSGILYSRGVLKEMRTPFSLFLKENTTNNYFIKYILRRKQYNNMTNVEGR